MSDDLEAVIRSPAPADNMQKYENYKEQFERLKRALDQGFHLEAMFIEYAILEDRTESILRHAEKWEAYLKSRRGREPNIDSKIRYIQKLAENRRDPMHRYFSDALLGEILTWKEERNRMIHALLKQNLGHHEVRGLAHQGNALAKALRSRSGAYRRVMQKQKAAAEA